MTKESKEFSTLLKSFFCEHLMAQKNVSPETVASYRDTFRVLLHFFREKMNRDALGLTVEDLNAENILAFLDHLENGRGNSVRTRNIRLAAIRTYMRFVAAVRGPQHLALVQRVMVIPFKRANRKLVGFLPKEMLTALLEAPNKSTRSGRRDRTMFTFMYNTGARVSETVALRVSDLSTGSCSSVRIRGKGRKERALPLWKSTAAQLKVWIRQTGLSSAEPLFPNRRGGVMSRSGVDKRLKEAADRATRSCPGLAKHQVSPHILRHTTAMHMLQSGVTPEVIALWLGHESPSTTHMYVEADLEMKENALKKVGDPDAKSIRYTPDDELIRFLDSL